MQLAQLVLLHRLMPLDPLRHQSETQLAPLFDEGPARGDVSKVNLLG